MKTLNVPKGQANLNNVVIKITNEDKERYIRFAVYIAMHSAVSTIDHLTDILEADGKASFEKMRLHRTMCANTIKYVVGSSLLENLLEDNKDKPFSVIVDESTDITINKYMCICVKYYSAMAGKVVTTFLTIIEVEVATAVELYKLLKITLTELGLNLGRLIGIGTDGGNNLCGRNYFLYTLLKQENPKIQLVRCISHSLNLAASHAIAELPACIDFLCREVLQLV